MAEPKMENIYTTWYTVYVAGMKHNLSLNPQFLVMQVGVTHYGIFQASEILRRGGAESRAALTKCNQQLLAGSTPRCNRSTAENPFWGEHKLNAVDQSQRLCRALLDKA